MSPTSLGDAYVSVHADTSAFKTELDAQVKAALAAVEAQNARVGVGATPSPTGGRSRSTELTDEEREARALSALQAQILKDDLANQQVAVDKERELETVRVAEAAAANAKIKADNTAFSASVKAGIDELKIKYAELGAAETAAYAEAAARSKAANDAFNASVKAGIDELKAKYAELGAAETAAYAEQATRNKAVVDAQRAAATAQRDVDAATKDLNKDLDTGNGLLSSFSRTLSNLGLSGQARLIALGLTLGAPIAALGAFALAAGAAGAAITVFGIQAADAVRSATLQFQSLGLSTKQATQELTALQSLANEGLGLSNLDQDVNLLLQTGASASTANAALNVLANSLAASGDVGKQLQTDLDATTKSLASLADTAKINSVAAFNSAVKSLAPLGITAEQVAKQLGLTNAQIDALGTKKGIVLSGAQVAQASLQVAAQGSQGALATAVQQSPTQALAAAKSAAQNTLADAFKSSGPAFAQLIGQGSKTLDDFLASFAPKFISVLSKTLPGILSAIQPLGNALISSLQLVAPLLKDVGTITSGLSKDISGFFTQFNTQGSQTRTFVLGLKTDFLGVVQAIQDVTPFLKSIADGIATVVVGASKLGPVLKPIGDAIKAIGNNSTVSAIVALATAFGLVYAALGKIGSLIAKIGADSTAAATQEAVLAAASTRLAEAQIALAEATLRANGALEGQPAAAAAAAAADSAAATRVAGASAAEGVAIRGASTAAAEATPVGRVLTVGVLAIAGAYGVATAALNHFNPVVASNTDRINALKAALTPAVNSLKEIQGPATTASNGLQHIATEAASLANTLPNVGNRAVELGNILVNQLGLSSDQARVALESLGFSAQDTNSILAGFSTASADAQMNSLAGAAANAAGQVVNLQASLRALNSAPGPLGTLGGLPIQGPVGFSGPGTIDNGLLNGLSFQNNGGGAIGGGAVPAAGGGGGGGSSGPTAAQTRAQNFQQAIQSILDSLTQLGQGFTKSTQTFTPALLAIDSALKVFTGNTSQAAQQIDSSFTQINKSLTAAFSADKTTEPSALVKLLKDDNAQLDALATQRSDIENLITTGTQAITSTITAAQNFGSLTSAASTLAVFNKSLTDLSKLHIVLPGDSLLTATGSQNAVKALQTTLDQRLKALQDFQKNIQTLISEGLNANSVQDLINGGVDQNGVLAAALAKATPAQIAAINATEAAVNTVAAKLGNNAGDAAAAAGQSAGEAVVNGILVGLQSKDAELTKAMQSLANKLVDQIKKDLKIKSPSRVMMELGGHVGTGLAHGIIGTHGAIAAAARGMAMASVPAFGRLGGPSGAVAVGPTHSREYHAPITINNYGQGDRTGESVTAAFSNLMR